MTVPILPVNITFNEWASQLRPALPHLDIPISPDVKDWRDWALKVSMNNLDFDIPLATELAYPKPKDWRRWAAYFINTVFVN